MKSLQCDRCGGVLPFQEELGGGCPRCLLEIGIAANTLKLEDEASQNLAGHLNAGTYVGRYCILRPIGDGGMGVVYEAEQERPRRHVALKLIRPGMTGKATLRRFERETQALGRLQHPGIAQIYDAGAADTGFGPQPYFAMELIRGLTPGEYVKQHRLSVRERLELVAKVAEAVHHAHQRGVIHRDLKPSNILVDETGQPKVLDFGVSRAVDDSAPHTHQTEKGQLLGTVAYMSPEQVTGDPHEIDIRTDIYALGVILYELLADRPPYDVEGNLHEALTAVREVEPTPLGTLVRDCKGDIETIAAKALEKDKNRRYTSAAELAADIRRFLSEEPIIARPPTAAYQLKKFARRNKVLVTAAAVVTAALLLGVVISTWQASRARLAQQAALVDRDRALQAEAMATEQRNLALDAQRQAEAAGETAIAERDRANVERNRAQNAEDQARRDARVANTQRLVAITQYLVREALRPETVRDDYDLASALVVQAQRFSSSISAEPRQAVEDALQKALSWNPLRHNFVTGGNSAYRSVAFSSDGDWLAAGGNDETVRVWNMRHPSEAPLLLDARGVETQGINAVTFSNSGQLLAVGSLRRGGGLRADSIRIWNLESRDPPLVLQGGGNIDSLSFSPDGKYLASATHGAASPLSAEPTVILWDLRNPGAPRVLSRDPAPLGNYPFGRVSFSPDGSLVAAASSNYVKVWQVQTPTAAPSVLQWPEAAPTSGVSRLMHSVAFSPDGVHLATGSSEGVHLWDLRNLQTAPIALALPSSSGAHQFRLLTFSRDGDHLASVSGQIWIWDLQNPTARPPFYGNNNLNAVNGLSLSPDGTRAAAATPSGIQLWDFSPKVEQPVLSAPLPRDPLANSRVRPMDFVYSTDLTRAVDASSETIRLWDLRSAKPVFETLDGNPARLPYMGGNRSMMFCGNNTRVAIFTRSPNGVRLSVWDLRTGLKPELTTSLDVRFVLPRNMACSAEGASLAIVESSSQQSSLRVIEPGGVNRNGEILPVRSAAGIDALAFSPDGTTLAFGMDQAVYVWNLRRPGTPQVLPMPAFGVPAALAFSSDGSWLAASSSSTVGQAAVWDLRNPSMPAQQLPSGIAMAFSHDQTRLATSSGNSIRIWDLTNPGAQSLNFIRRAGPIVAIAFTPDNTKLKAGDLDGRVTEWPLWSAAADVLCTRIWRNLSMSEWEAHVGEDIPYDRTCPNLPPGAGARGGPK